VLAVRDPGIGIPAEDLGRVFERFQRASNAAGRIAGTGIGLASVRSIVESHGGSVGVQSCVGQGSTFTIRLPLRADVLGLDVGSRS
jgi:signal transduction histidine kinase